MKFHEIPYERPDFDRMFSDMQGALAQMREAKDENELFAAMKVLDKLSKTLDTQSTLAYIRHSIDTRDEFYSKEQDVLDEALPRFGEINASSAHILLNSPFRDAVEKKYGRHLLEKAEVAEKVFKPEIVEDLVEEGKLSTQYDKLMASAEIEFEGKTYNLSGLAPLMESTDRETRRRASEAHWGWMAGHSAELDDIYDKLVRVRDRIGRKLGFENFIPVAYARMGRTDWNQEDAKNYRQQIIDSVVPLAEKIYKAQAERIGIDDMKYYDYSLQYLTGNPRPQGDEPYLVERAKEMYKALSPETDVFFRLMTDNELMDLSTKPGKAPGGYMTFLPDYKFPFIFSNFNGTSGDVDVLTHEAGHAFQGWLQRDTELSSLSAYTQEVAEIHSMSMEFFAHPWMETFFGADTEKYFDSHVADALLFLPYGASVDAFQEWVYEHPEATPKERNAQYREIQRIFQPHLDYDGNEYLESGARWQKQLHIYGMPFYYLDYTLSQVCALQYFVWDRKEHKEAWNSYLKLCMESGRKPFKQLVADCGLKDPFQNGTIAAITPVLQDYLASLDREQIK